MTQVLDHGYVNLIEEGCWGSDRIIIESARMSTRKGFLGWEPEHYYNCPHDGGGYSVVRPTKEVVFCHCGKTMAYDEAESHRGDQKLLKYLWDHKHLTPFEMAGLTIEVQAPIMVFREWHRHRTQSYNEMSGRYTELPNLYYIPDYQRIQRQSLHNKQGSGAAFEPEEQIKYMNAIYDTTRMCRHAYEELLKAGVSREIARLILPVNQYSRMRASGNLRNWLAFLTLRTDEAAQWEIQQYAHAVLNLIWLKFPRTYELFIGE